VVQPTDAAKRAPRGLSEESARRSANVSGGRPTDQRLELVENKRGTLKKVWWASNFSGSAFHLSACGGSGAEIWRAGEVEPSIGLSYSEDFQRLGDDGRCYEAKILVPGVPVISRA